MQELRNKIMSYYDYVDTKDFENLFSLFSDSIIYSRSKDRLISGIDELKRFYLLTRGLGTGTHRIMSIFDFENTVIVKGAFDGKFKDGNIANFVFVDFFEFSDGKIIRRSTYTDVADI